MRNMSFFITTQQIIDETKDITRRFGWWFLVPGDRLCAVEKCQGLKKGEKINRLKIIEAVSTRGEPLNAITKEDCIREGFPEFEPCDFVDMLVKYHKCKPDAIINRIEFKYVKESEKAIY